MILIQLVPVLVCALSALLFNPLLSETGSSRFQSNAKVEKARRCSGGTAHLDTTTIARLLSLSPRGTSGERDGERGCGAIDHRISPLSDPLPTPSSWGEGNICGASVVVVSSCAPGGTAVCRAVEPGRPVCQKAADEVTRDQLLRGNVPGDRTSKEVGKECDESSNSQPNKLEGEVLDVLNRLGPPAKHYDGIHESEAQDRLKEDRNYRELLREKVLGKWFAALLFTKPGESFSIAGRFETWKGLLDFILERDALVEVWAYGEGL